MTIPVSPDQTDAENSTVYNRVFWLAYLANVSLVTANALTFRFAELVHYLGGSEKIAGDIVSLGLIVAVVVRFSFSHVLDHYGPRRMWILMSVLFIAGSMLFLVIDDLGWPIYAARVAYVVGLTGMFACSIMHIQNQVPAHRRTEVIGNLGSSGFLGMIAGAQLGDWMFHTIPDGRPQFIALFGSAAVLGFVYLLLVLAATRNEQHERPVVAIPAFRLVYRYWPGPVVLVALIMGLSITVTMVFLTRFATSIQLSGIGTFFTAYALCAFSFRLAVQNWSRRYGRYWMLVMGLCGHAAGHLMLTLVSREWHFLFPAVACGFGHALLFPAVVSLGSGAFPREYRGSGTAITLAFVDAGTILFAPLLGRIIVYSGFDAMFLTSAGLALVAAGWYALVALRVRDDELLPQQDAAPSATLALSAKPGARERAAAPIAAKTR